MAAKSLYTVSYEWVPTKEEMEMLERYSSIWSEEDWERSGDNPYMLEHERCNAIQRLVRARLFLDTNIYLIHAVDETFGAVYRAPVAGYKSGIKPTGLKDDPLGRKSLGKARGSANITQMLLDAKARLDAEQAAKEAAITAEHAKACAVVAKKNAAILAEAEKAWRQAGAPPTMAERMRGIKEKPQQPSWEEWQKGIVYMPEPSRAQVAHEMELAPFLAKELPDEMGWSSMSARESAEWNLAQSKAPRAAGHMMAGTWQHWEVAVLDPFIQRRMEMVPY